MSTKDQYFVVNENTFCVRPAGELEFQVLAGDVTKGGQSVYDENTKPFIPSPRDEVRHATEEDFNAFRVLPKTGIPAEYVKQEEEIPPPDSE